ncbi:MAG TPA: ATP-binding protein, partial [Labilithrix sp.]
EIRDVTGARSATVLVPRATEPATFEPLAFEGAGAGANVTIDDDAVRAFRTGVASWEPSPASLPLVVGARPIGVVVLDVEPASMVSLGRVLVEAMLELGALSLDRVARVAAESAARDRLQAAERSVRAAAERLGLMLEASEAIARGTDPEDVLDRLVHATVPGFADWCAVELLEDDGRLSLAAIAHVDSAKVAVARELRRRFPSRPDASAAHRVATSSKAELHPVITDAMLAASIHDPEELRLTRELGAKSLIVVPLALHDRALGALSIIATRDDLVYDATDVRLAEKLARSAALALQNARLIGELRARADAELGAKREAESANRLKDEFLATVSHELRTPLNAILGWASMLRSGRLDEATQQRAIATIERNARAQARLVDDVLDVSRITSGKLTIKSEPVDVARVLELTLDVVRPAALAKEITIEVKIASGLRVRADADRLQQIYWNVLANAVKFTPRGGRIVVVAAQKEKAVVVSVKDSGPGIAREFLPHLFEPFRQADGSTTRAHGGLGLGLSIARRLVLLHGGDIAAESDGPGHGATFVIALPATGDELPNPTTTGRHLAASRLLGVDVLVVDDEPDARELAAMVLVDEGASVRTAGSAREAIERVSEKTPGVLVCDVGMPEEDGLMFLPRARAAAGVSFPAVAYTAYADAESAEAVRRAGFDAHVAKPVDPDQLVAAVARLAG